MECPYKKIKLSDNDENDADNKIESFETETPENPRELMILDEVNDIEEQEEAMSESESSNSGSEFNFDEDIESMLDERLPEELKSKRKDHQYEERFKTVMEEKGTNHFEVLPEGWVQATHDSGIPLYLHKHTRVCTTTRPYFLGPGSVRKHEIPLSSIPCYSYRKALDKEKEYQKLLEDQKKQQENQIATPETPNEPVTDFGDSKCAAGLNNILNIPPKIANPSALLSMPNAKIETVSENLKAQSLTHGQVTEYCKKLFKFKTIRVLRFKSWEARRKFTKNRKHIKHLQRPSLPDGTKLITFPVMSVDTNEPNQNDQVAHSSRPKKEWIMNPNGKSYVCILHEYVQHALKKQPTYEFKELENAATPYSATVSINNLKYGTGYGTSKKQAKSEAARETLEILIPEMKEKITGIDKNTSGSSTSQAPKDLSVFDEIRIEDPRVAEFCAKTTEPSPHAILLTCLQRNYGLGDIKIDYAVNTSKHKKNEFTMTVNNHTAKVYCKNKRDGKQRASQAILQMLHPHIKTWGSLLRLYGNKSVKSFKEKKQEEQEITVLQSKAAVNQPNYAILEKLKLEMSKLMEKRSQIADKVIGKVIAPIDLPLSSANVNLNL